ncbi:hypothetical protein MPNT_20017 [Candidatus Methylacidithermus pantelleriae]|uniref:Uncharacterized protein n=1 Tax=Candidatus Methylacidithermus pantelleriae TaxID=2744239 RepID=A0A8J2BM90_9BACT|nr:hypothetical protein MPNT_20017 [Candidatus Methylacidithermus pantelleriae]
MDVEGGALACSTESFPTGTVVVYTAPAPRDMEWCSRGRCASAHEKGDRDRD